MSCNICKENYSQQQILLPCCHGFCQTCFDGDTCPTCLEPHFGNLTPVHNFFPIPCILDVLLYFGIRYVRLPGEAKPYVDCSVEKCFNCMHYGLLYDTLDIKHQTVSDRSFCSVCSNFIYNPSTKRVEGNAELFFEAIEKKSNRKNIGDSYDVLSYLFGKSVEEIEILVRRWFSNFSEKDFISEEDCSRLLQLVIDCIPKNVRYSDRYKIAMNKIFKTVGPHCLRWDAVPQFQHLLKQFRQAAFGYNFDGANRKLNATFVIYFTYCLRMQIMKDIDWIGHSFPDESAYIRDAILANLKPN